MLLNNSETFSQEVEQIQSAIKEIISYLKLKLIKSTLGGLRQRLLKQR